jgi:phospholipid/cholesterol/gamma-HCH transport system substrate-binding protein
MENKSHALAAGAFLLGLAALLIGLAVWLTRDNSEHRVYELSSREGVTGLQPQAGVRYKGVSVGRVTAIELDRQTAGNVLVRIALNAGVPITQSTFATLGFQGVTGLAFIQLDDSGESTQALATSRDQIARIPMRPGLMTRLSDQGSSLLLQLEQASQRINALLAPDNQKSLMGAIGNLGQAAAHIGQLKLPQLVQDASASIKGIQATTDRLGDSADSVKTSAQEFNRMSTRMTAPGGTLDKIADGADALVATGQSLSATLVPRLNRTVDDTARAVRQIGRAADAVTESPQSLLLGKGAAAPGPGESGFVAPPAR